MDDVVMIPFSSIEIDEKFNARGRKNGDYADKHLMNSIQKYGLITPLSVVMRDDTYKLILGFRRYAALKALSTNDKPVAVVIRTFKNDDELWKFILDIGGCEHSG